MMQAPGLGPQKSKDNEIGKIDKYLEQRKMVATESIFQDRLG